MGDPDHQDYKPYTTPYTGAGAVRTESGWVNLRDHGPPGAASGPGVPLSGNAPAAPFHSVAVTGTTVPPPQRSETDIPSAQDDNPSRNSENIGPSPNSRRGSTGKTRKRRLTLETIKRPDGEGYDLPCNHTDLDQISNQDIAMIVGLLQVEKGAVHESLQRTFTDQEMLTRDFQHQLQVRNEHVAHLDRVQEAIRAWESVQQARTDRLISNTPGLVDVVMHRRDREEKEKAKVRIGNGAAVRSERSRSSSQP
ncbi:hypothetical protein F5X96DRAFT_662871 [Biscogniauxia mediterranea]|nr:hypothetical protein F5X96DRAFT_662871 [Biscogniauxia mediterranea]